MASLESFKGFRHTLDQDPSWEGFPNPQIEKSNCVLNWLLGKIQCSKAIVENDP